MNVKMIIVLFKIRGIVHRELITPGQIINQILKCLREDARRKRPNFVVEMAASYITIMLPQTQQRVNRYLAPYRWSVIPHRSYSLDLATCHFLFPGMEKNLKVKPFSDVDEIKTASQLALDDIKVEDFPRSFKQ